MDIQLRLGGCKWIGCDADPFASKFFTSLITGENKGPEYATFNPSRLVPTLEITKADVEGSTAMSITQSLAVLEYLDEAYSETYQLLPSTEQVGLRAVIRTLCHIIASGM